MELDPLGGFGMFNIMSVLFPVFFIIVLGFIVFSIIRGISEWSYNNQQPRLTVNAVIVAKRQHVSHRHGGGDNMHHHSSTTYYITFEVESSDRMELRVPSYEYGLLAEGDPGRLTFQGTRFLAFARNTQ